MNPLESLIRCGTKLWIDSIDPQLVADNKRWGASGATSNPIIVSDLIQSGRFDSLIERGLGEDHSAEEIAWQITDTLVQRAQAEFDDVWQATRGNDGYVSFELDSLIEDPQVDLPHDLRVQRYIDEGLRWSRGHRNRMIKVPATPAGLDAVETLVAEGVPLNITLVFSNRQYEAARDAVWRGAQRLKSRDLFKSVFSIFVSRIDLYTEKHAASLSSAAQGLVGIVNAQRIWAANQNFWSGKQVPLQQEIVFASTGTKKASDPPWKYVAALAGSDIQTNPPATNAAALASGQTFERRVDQLPDRAILEEIDRHVDFNHLETTLMREGIDKFVTPQRSLLQLIHNRQRQCA